MKKILVLLCVLLPFASCREKAKDGTLLSTPTSGTVKMAVDAALQPVMVAETEAFEAIYQYADVQDTYTSEKDAIESFLKDSVQLIAITRKLTAEEQQILEKQKIIPKQLAIAREGIALITNKNNPDSLFQLNSLKDLLQGKLTSWKQLNKASSLGNIRVVFDQPNAGIVRFLRDSIAPFDQLPSYCFAVDSDSAVIDYVAKEPNAIGFIGVSWVSDHEDATANRFLKTIRVAGIYQDDDFYQPYQAYIAQRKYPLTREIVIISREARAGLATGFMAFAAGDKGQRVVLKAGLVPTTMPLRIVEVNRDPF